ncbi:MAG: methylamine utilization protein MauJ [Planctomycetota bacterium]
MTDYDLRLLAEWPCASEYPVLPIGLYRQGRVAADSTHALLEFFKVINVFSNTGAAQRAWIARQLPALGTRRRWTEANDRIQHLGMSVADAAAYLFESGRCAVAHSYSDPVVDPDDARDLFRLARDLPVMQALAEHALVAHFAVPEPDWLV